MSDHSKIKNGRGNHWKGGRTITSHGYVLVWVGKDHHLADRRGYAYEHRVVAERKLGRRLVPGEQIHHRNGVKSDNRDENIEVKSSRASHAVEHRKSGSTRRLPGEKNDVVECACGCGSTFPKFDRDGRSRRYVSGHNVGRNSVGRFVALVGRG